MSDESSTDDDADTADYRQVSFVALAGLALVLAAAFAPGMTGESSSSPGFDVDSDFEWDGDLPDFDFDIDIDPDTETDSDGDGGDAGDGGSEDGPDGDFDWRKLLEWFDIDRDGDGGEENGAEPECVIGLDREPVPGSQLTATIRYAGEPLAETPVWFDDRRVGETDENGRVTGEVPYVNELVIRVGVKSDATCRTGTPISLSSVTAGTPPSLSSVPVRAASQQPTDASPLSSEREAAAIPAPSAGLTALSSAATAATGTLGSTGLAVSTVPVASMASTASTPTLGAASTQDDASANATGTYEVDADVEIDIDGDPYPGETITVEATIEGEPMTEATVSVDGTAVGETGADGTAAIRVPDDGTDEFEVTVARREFAGTTTVDVLLLEATFSPDGIAPVPGSPGAIEATIDGEPVEGAEVTVDGEYDGTTDDDGRLAIGLPRDPTTTVTISTDRQTASVSLLGEYGSAALLIAFGIAGLAALSSRTFGRHGPIAVLGATATLTAVLVAEAFYGRTGGLAVLGVVGLFGLGVVLSRLDRDRPSPSVRDLPSIRDRLNRLASRFVDLALRAVDGLEALLERGRALAGALREWLRSLPRSGRALLARFADRLRTLPGRVRSRLENALAAARTLPLRTVAAGLGAAPLIAGGYVVDGVRGATVVAVAVVVAGIVLFRSDESETEPTATDDESEQTDREPAGASRSTDETRSFRELWRSFARQVSPGRWRTRTPGEIERRALSMEYPRAPVRELTALFREVEYGGRPRSSDRREKAAKAYDAVERSRVRDEPTESVDEDRDESASATDSNDETEPPAEDEP